MKTEIINNGKKWVLIIKRDGHMFRAWPFRQLIEAVNMASALQLHISNIEALPLGQYAYKG